MKTLSLNGKKSIALWVVRILLVVIIFGILWSKTSLFASKITVNDQTFIPRKTLTIDDFHRLVCKDATGEKTVVYDATVPGIIVRLLVSLIVLTVILIYFKIKRKTKEKIEDGSVIDIR